MNAANQLKTPERTKRTIANLGSLNPKALEKIEPFYAMVEKVMADQNIRVEVISGLRSYSAQAALYAQGRTTKGKIVTKAAPGSSWHNYGLAIDLGLFQHGVYLDEANPRLAEHLYGQIGKIADSRDIEWAGHWKSFPESPHFQVTFGMTIAQAKKKLESVGFAVEKLV